MAPLHPHIHYLCPGGGLLLDGSGWRDVPTTGKKQRLVPLAVLRTRYRQLFLAGLKKLYAAGKLRLPGKLVALTDPAAFDAFVLRLDAVDWVVHCKGPPLGYGQSVAAMKYLAGYVRGTAICDARIVADDGEHVSYQGEGVSRRRYGRNRDDSWYGVRRAVPDALAAAPADADPLLRDVFGPPAG